MVLKPPRVVVLNYFIIISSFQNLKIISDQKLFKGGEGGSEKNMHRGPQKCKNSHSVTFNMFKVLKIYAWR